jgi:hypothetical protein
MPASKNSPVAALYEVEGYPAHFLLDKNGSFASDNVPYLSQEEELIAAIDQLLK